MKKVICISAVLAMCLVLMCPAFAAEDTFVPSISYKDGPEIEDAEMEGDDVAECLVVTSLKKAEEKTTDIYQTARDLLLNIYGQLKSNNMKLSVEEGYVVRELVDISWKYNGCVQNEHTHEEDHEKELISVTIDFDLGLAANYDLIVLAYRDGQWEPIESAVNNGDGTVTCVFEHFCPVAFCVKEQKGGSETGDPAGQRLILWVGLMVASSATLLFMICKRRKHAK